MNEKESHRKDEGSSWIRNGGTMDGLYTPVALVCSQNTWGLWYLTWDKLHLFPSPTKPASVAVICFLKMIIADSSAQKPGYTQGWLKRHCRGQKVGQSSPRSQGRVNHVRVLHFFQSTGYHRSPLAGCTSQYPQAELTGVSLSYTRGDLATSVSWSLPTPLTHTEENIAQAEAEPRWPRRSWIYKNY